MKFSNKIKWLCLVLECCIEWSVFWVRIIYYCNDDLVRKWFILGRLNYVYKVEDIGL